ncbi:MULTISPECIES: 2-oxoacid:acceptor oxidoreductase family protein [unclassified Thermoplasma]|uniref:2-oxoacid:acceptor oxidoreductase family protein n=1 Tax=unclassified Thermoplasma TaxID=2684908 RepID=UPI000D9B1DE7|nr:MULTISPECIES: 2-oxoacid:acceptor oxidoreductase family protein [unclassified Thermoplasma]PYB68362.1 pyruvate ferredoxin oxidoreductase [Thermoplasma sp. Kam2015]
MYEIRFHGRGGQGAVTASRILAAAAFAEGKYVVSFPFFGTERRGAPVTAFTRIDDSEIYLKSQIYNPDIVVVLDTYVLRTSNVTEGLKDNGIVIINSPKDPSEFNIDANVATVDAVSIAVKHGLGSRANPVINTSMLGAFAKVTGLVSLESVLEATRTNVPGKIKENMDAVREAYDSVKMLKKMEVR